MTVTGRSAVVHPLAGTRPRGATPEDDVRLAAELLADPKERAEHVMLVDLARNDLGRVCVPGTVEVPEFMRVERYSHVMHIVSTVSGEVADGPRRPRRARRDLPGRHRVRRAQAARDGDHRGAGADPARRCTRARSATSTPAATWTWRSRSAPPCCTRAGRTCRPGPGSSPTATRPTEEAETRNKARAVLSAIATAEGLRELR